MTREPTLRQPRGVSPCVAEHALRLAVGQHAAVGAEHDHAVDERQPHLDPVLDRRRASSNGRSSTRATASLHLEHPGRVEVRRRFVEQQQAGPHGQHTGQRQALLLPAGERARCGVIQADVESDGVEGFAAPGARSRRAATPRFSQPNATSSPTRARITWESGSCSTRPTPAPGCCGPASPSMRSAPLLLALLVAAEHAGEAVQQGRLAGAGCAEQQHPLARLDREVERR